MNKRLVLSMVMCFCFIFVWNYIGVKFGFIREVPVEEPTQTTEITEQVNPTAPSSPISTDPEETGDGAEAAPAEPQIEQRTVVLQNDELRLTFDNRGGVIISAVLKEHYNSAERLEKVRLVTPTRYFPGDIRLPGSGSTRNLMFAVEESENKLTFTHQSGELTIRKEFTLAENFKLATQVAVSGPDSTFDMVIAEGLQPILPGDKLTPSIWDMGAISPKILKTSWSEDGSHEERMPDDEMNFNGFDSLLKQDEFIDWVGVQDTYFANVFLLEKPARNALIAGVKYSMPDQSDPAYIPAVAISADQELKGQFYMGPLEEEALVAADPHLENLISYGWAGLLSKALFVGLKFFHGKTANWGWAIVIMTLCIRVIMIPMMVPSLKSGYKMRQLQPKMEKLKQKYAGEDLETKQKLSQETFKLYKEEGVNPFSSCFSLFLQMPIFFAYFGLLRASITLRQAEWHFWIADLSIKDPYYVLPILMALTMFFSTMLTPMPSADPLQQRMMKIMPLLFAFMFIGMPAGLVLYMITNNMFTMVQNVIMKRRYDT